MPKGRTRRSRKIHGRPVQDAYLPGDRPTPRPRPLQLADPQLRGPKLPKLPPGAVRVQPKRGKSRAARRGKR